MTKTHDFDRALELATLDEGTVSGRTTTPYANMVGPYGGITSALHLKAVLIDERATGDPISQTVNFCGSIANGEFTIRRTLQRAGKYLQHWSTELIQDESVRSTATIVIGQKTEVFSHQTVAPPNLPAPGDVEKLQKGMPLRWIDSFDLRFIKGGPNFTGKLMEPLGDAETQVWVNHEEPRQLDYLGLAAISDTFFLRNLNVRGTFPAMGTVTLTTYFHSTQDEIAAQGTNLLLGIANCKRFHANISDQQADLWGQDGTLLATSYQLAWYKE